MVKTLCKSDYQDIYRVTHGVLLVINKFKCITDSHGYPHSIGHSVKSKSYSNDCQKELKVLVHDYYDEYRNVSYKAGQVIYDGCPVKLVDRDEWEYQVKTTGTALSGEFGDIIMLLNEIISKIMSSDS